MKKNDEELRTSRLLQKYYDYKDLPITSTTIRDVIIGYLLVNNGVDFASIKEGLNLSDKRLKYHLNVLIKQGKLCIKSIDGKKVYTPIFPERMKCKKVQSRYKAVIEIIQEKREVTQADIVRLSNIPQSSVSRLLKDLRKGGLIVSSFDEDGTRRYSIFKFEEV